jgi:DNA-binding transcriptional MerR regulator
VSKGPEAFRTISEVASDLELPQHVLRFWETRFTQIRPMKRGGGRRYYRPDDVDLLRGIRHLLYADGYTIRGVQRILRDQGPRFVVAVGKGEATPGDGAAPESDEADDFAYSETENVEADVTYARRRVAHAPEEAHPMRASDSRAHSNGQNGGAAPGALTKEEVRRLQSTLFELLECKRLLDQTR